MPPLTELQWFASLGVGGVLAGMMFFYYRRDRRNGEARLIDMGQQQLTLTREFRSIVENNTRAMERNSEALAQQLQALERLDRAIERLQDRRHG
jgi:uncharacterized protein HemX